MDTPKTIPHYLQQNASAVAVAKIDLERVRANYRAIRRHVPESAQVIPIIKGDGYGHGSSAVAAALVAEGAQWVGVATPDEGVTLRQEQPDIRIVVLSRVVPWNVGALVEWGLTPLVCNREVALALDALARAQRQRVNVHLQVDTGMGRLGVKPDEALDFIGFLRRLPNLRVEGICSHFATADEAGSVHFEKQLARFREVAAAAKAACPELTMAHCANSPALFHAVHRVSFDAVRPGLLLYGVAPMELDPPPFSVEPALSLHTRIIHLQDHPQGSPISYGGTYVTPGQRRIATIPLGYRDGLFRALSNVGWFLVRGHRAPIVGNICMDLAMLDVTEVPDVRLYDEVTLIGHQGDEEVTAHQWADWIGTIPYEILCALGNRIERRYIADEREQSIPHPLIHT